MEASDGEEEKSQESCEEKEEVDRRSRQPARPQARSTRQGWGQAGKAAAKPAAPMMEAALSEPYTAVAPGAGPAPKPRSSLVVPMDSAP